MTRRGKLGVVRAHLLPDPTSLHARPLNGTPAGVTRSGGPAGTKRLSMPHQSWQRPTEQRDHHPIGLAAIEARAKRERIAASIKTKLNRIAWNGDPSITPPALSKPTKAPEPLGYCDDDQMHLPPHKRQRRKPEET